MKSENQMAVHSDQTISLKGSDGTASISFNLKDVKMSKQQEAIVKKLFSQHPQAELTLESHNSHAERGMTGPGSQYLTQEEFEQVRTLGVRLVNQEAAGPIVDFCLHVVNVGPLQSQFD